MPDTFGGRLRHAWNAFVNPTPVNYNAYQHYSGVRPDRTRLSYGNEKSVVSAIYTRIGIDVAQVGVQHVRLDQNGSFTEVMSSGLQKCLSVEANIDQSGRALIQDIAMTLFDEGTAAIVPVDTTINPEKSGGFEINTLRVGTVIEWYPQHVRMRLYNDRTGQKEEIVMAKKAVAIIENPLYSVMNEQNSTLKRLVRKLNLLDATDEKLSAGKLDIIIQLPYSIKTDMRRAQAEERRKDIEVQLTGSSHGIAYIDGTEKVTQLNRPAENNLLEQVDSLTRMLYSQLGLTEGVFNGTADESEMLNYYNRTIEPILAAITEGMDRKFVTTTARTQGQKIIFTRDPFKLVPISQLADIADKFTRNEILSSNEVRSIIGMKPAKDPAADELRNKNLNQSKQPGNEAEIPVETETEGERQNGS